MKLRLNLLIKAKIAAGALLCGGLLCSPAYSALLEEIVVTAQKREQNLQDVGISVTAFSGNQIRELGYTNTIDIAAQTPGLGIIQFHPTLTTTNIRGISQNDFADHLEPPIAMYVDESYVSAMGAGHTQLYDLQRVEVLRGPQGTLFGRNATGGLLHYISAKPTEDPEGYLEFTYGSYDQKKFEGAISGPLTDNLLARVSFAGNFHDGVAENRIGPDVRGSEHYALRGQLEFRPSEEVTLNLKAHYANDDDEHGNAYTHTPISANEDGLGFEISPDSFVNGFCPGCDFYGYRDPDGDPFTGSYDYTGEFRRSVAGITGRLTWDTGNVTVTSITDYLQMNKNYGEDTDGSPNPVFVFITDQDFEQFSQELRFNGDVGENLRWTTGFYYLDIEHAGNLNYFLDLPFYSPTYSFGEPTSYISGPTTNNVETESWAVFGHLEYDLNENWGIIAALRYTEDQKDTVFQSADVLGGNVTGLGFTLTIPFDLAADPDFDLFDQSFENVSAKFEIDWRPTDDTLVFASFNRGHKAGAARVQAGGNPTTPIPTYPHDEEVLHSWEIGIKTTFMDGRAQLNASAFYYDYQDYQAFVVIPGAIPASLTIINLDAEAVGGEVELTLQPTEGWGFRFGASFEDSEVKDVLLPSGRFVDNDLPYAPSFTLNGLARYEWPALGGTMAIQGDFNYSEDFCFSVLCAPLDQEDSFVIGNFRVSYTNGDENWKLAAFVNNVSDTEYRLYTLDISGLSIGNDAYANPRWAGGTITFNWQ